MNRKQLFHLILLLMIVTATATAQKTGLPPINWKVAGELPAVPCQTMSLGVAGPVAGVHQDHLLVAGGANFPEAAPWLGGKKMYYSEGFVFRSAGADSLVSVARFSLPFPLGYSAVCSTPLGVVAAGGENEAGLRNDVLLLQVNGDSSTVTIRPLPSLPFAVTNAALVFHNNKLYLAGGETADAVSRALLVLDLTAEGAGWKTLPPLPKAVSHASMVVQSNGKGDGLYLLGGRKRNPGSLSDLYATVFRFDLDAERWVAERPLPYALSAGTALPVSNRYILLFGGDTGETFHQAEALIAAIASEGDATEKKLLNDKKISVQSTHPGFCRQVLLYDTKKRTWADAGCLSFPTPVTTTAVAWQGGVLLPSGEIRAGVRSPQILFGELGDYQSR